MNLTRTMTLGLTLTGLCALGTLAARPAAAQELTYKLGSVTFDDGAVAFGYFDFNPTTGAFGPFDITTTDGVTDSLTGFNYTSASSSPFQPFGGSDFFVFGSNSTINTLALVTDASATGPGLYTLAPGTVIDPNTIQNSGEFAPSARAIETGYLYVVETNPVPEASTTVSLGVLLALGMGSMVVAAKRKKAGAAA